MKIEISKVTSKGQVVIPSKLRKRLGIREGTQVVFAEEESRLVLQPLTKDYVAKLRGLLAGARSPLKTILEDRRKENK
ncbi:MAG: AbrB/MazE/SpoVT family DNA-binding domain-containing protein [Candidatus Acidiferrales bacterium]